MPTTDAFVRLKLLGAQAFNATARGASRSVDGIEKSARRADRALGSMARTAGVLGGAGVLGALAYGAGKVGFGFNQMQDAQRVAFTTFLRSGAKAQKLMGQIQQLALDSPILDPQSTGEAVRMLLAYGISVKRVIPLTKALGDMSAASGKSIADVMPRAALALGQIAGKGKLQAQEMNQLAESVGLSRKRIRQALGLTSSEFEATFKPGQNIKASIALPAIERAMRAQAAGAADMLAQTTAGRVARAKETMSMAAGAFTRPLYDAIGNALGHATGFLNRLPTMSRDFTAGLTGSATPRRGTMLGQRNNRDMSPVDRTSKAMGVGGAIRNGAQATLAFLTGKVIPGVKNVVGQVMAAFAPAMPFVRNVLMPLLKGIGMGILGGVVATFKIAIPVIKVVATVLGQLGTWARPLRGVFKGIGVVIGFLAGGPILKLLGGLKYIGVAFRVLAIPLRIANAGFRGLAAAGRGLMRGLEEIATAPGVDRLFQRLATGALNIVRTFTTLPHRIANGFRGGLKGLAGFFARVGKSIVTALIHAIKAAPGAITGALMSIVPGPLRGAVKKVLKYSPTGLAVGGAKKLLGLASGGTVRRGGWALVGERGPELANLPTGSTVYDHQQTRRARRGVSTMAPVVHLHPTVVVQQNPLGMWKAVSNVDRAISEAA